MAKKRAKKKSASKKKSFSSGYDAANGSNKRRASSSILKREEDVLKERARRSLIGTGQYLYRNFSVVSWAVKKHLDYNTMFDFQAQTDYPELNEQLESLMNEWSLPFNCDASARFTFQQLLRASEMRRVLDGDIFWIKRRDGRLGAIEGDLMRTPGEVSDGERWFNGARVNVDGRPIAWGLHRREDYGNVEFLRKVPAQNVIQLCQFDRFDQIRGVSPMAGAFNAFQDCYEGIDYALAKMKIEQLFAMVIYSSNSSGTGEHLRNGDGSYDVDFGKGPVKLEMDADDDAKFLHGDGASYATQDFVNLVLGMAIKSLGLPFSFFDEAHTNFFGSRAAFLHYDRSCKANRSVLLEALRRVTVWKMRQWILEGKLTLPSGMTVLDVEYEWVHAGMPWWDPSKEIDGDLKAISAGLDNPYRVCQRVGTDFEANIKKIAQAREFAESLDVPLTFGEFAEPTEYEVDEPVEEVGNEEEAEGNEEEATGSED